MANIFNKIFNKKSSLIGSKNHVVARYNLLTFPGFSNSDASSNAEKNSIVQACATWISRQFPESPLRVKRQTSSKDVFVPKHDLSILLRNPNPNFSRSVLWQATLPSLTIDGNAYWILDKSANPTTIWWAPNHTIDPVKESQSKNLIDYYRYSVNGKVDRIPVDRVVHLRLGIDPNDTKRGLAPLKSMLREVLTDNEAEDYTRVILSNLGMPGAIFMLKNAEEHEEMTPAQKKEFEETYKRKFSGEGRGLPLMLEGDYDVHFPSFNPEQLNLVGLRRIPEERISALFGVPAIVVGLGVGIEHATMANFREAREQAHESCIVPLQRTICEQLDNQLLPRFLNSDLDTEYCEFDNSSVRVFLEDENKLHDRIRSDFAAGLITIGQAMSALSLDVPAGEDENARIFDLQLGFSGEQSAMKRIIGNLAKENRRIWESTLDDTAIAG